MTPVIIHMQKFQHADKLISMMKFCMCDGFSLMVTAID